jgi:Ser/Thr protein kinase RdoA (MazF antagonist)
MELADGRQGLLRRHDPALLDPVSPVALADLGWLHGFLDRLTTTGFPAPVPLRVFDGESIIVHDGAIWEAVSFLPGTVVGWAVGPAPEAVGAFMATYHAAAGSVGPHLQRPMALPVAGLTRAVRGASGDPPSWLIELCEELAQRLEAVSSNDRLVIHGDFTNHNVLANGNLPAPVGIIDFALAHVEQSAADLAYGLWRSGRPFQEATWLDPNRVAGMVRGYCRVRNLQPEQAASIPAFMWGRGVQMAVKGVLRGRPLGDPPAQVTWIRTNQDQLTDLVVSAAEARHRRLE